MFVSSLFLGTSGTYNILGSQVEFVNNLPPPINFSDHWLGNLGQSLLKSHVFNVLTFGYMHTFVHEMGHAIASKIICGGPSKIQILTSSLSGITSYLGEPIALSPTQNSLIRVAGPLANLVFSVSQIFAAVALKHFLTLPVVAGLAIGASIWIFGEVFYAVNSLLKDDIGDFGGIARDGHIQLLGATIAMVSVIALGALATAQLL